MFIRSLFRSSATVRYYVAISSTHIDPLELERTNGVELNVLRSCNAKDKDANAEPTQNVMNNRRRRHEDLARTLRLIEIELAHQGAIVLPLAKYP